MLIPMNNIILANYVYVDSTGILNACKLCVLIQLGFGIIVNTVYVDPTWFLNASILGICWFQLDIIMFVNYVYVASNRFC